MPQERKHKPKSEQPVAGRDLYLFFLKEQEEPELLLEIN
jgi:hypothetical protein